MRKSTINSDEKFVNKLTVVIEDHILSDKLDTSFVAQKMCVSNPTLVRKTKRHTGLTPNSYIRKIKLRHSLSYLISGEYNISDSAFMAGFNDLDRFRMYFKVEFGMLPSEYLKVNRYNSNYKSKFQH